jgi:hypothetical protein
MITTATRSATAASAPPPTPATPPYQTMSCAQAWALATRSRWPTSRQARPCWTSAQAAAWTSCSPPAEQVRAASPTAWTPAPTCSPWPAPTPYRPGRATPGSCTATSRHPAARRSRRRRHLQLRHQPVRRQAPCPRRGILGPQARRQARRQRRHRRRRGRASAARRRGTAARLPGRGPHPARVPRRADRVRLQPHSHHRHPGGR